MRVPAKEPPPLDHGGPVDWPFEPFPHSALDASVSERFDEVAERYADRLAVSDLDRSLTYAELKLLADRIAAATAAATAGRPAPVGWRTRPAIRPPSSASSRRAASMSPSIRLSRSSETAASPATRGRKKSFRAAILRPGFLADFGRDVPIIDIERLPAIAARPAPRPAADDAAQIVYTSGSTGEPKCVFQNHRGLLYRAPQYINFMQVGHKGRVAMVYSPTASAGLNQIYTALLSGASLHRRRRWRGSCRITCSRL